jgi:hypothetical protein
VREMGIKVQKSMLEYVLREYGSDKVSILAEKMGVSPKYIYQVLKHDISVGNKFIRGLMKLTNLSFSALFYYSEEEDEGNGS